MHSSSMGALRAALAQARYRLEALRFRPDSAETIGLQVKLSGLVADLHERLHGSAEAVAADELQAVFRSFRITTRDPGIKSITELASDGGSWTGDGRGRDDEATVLR